MSDERSSESARWTSARRLQVYASVLALLLWGASAINYATYGTVSRNGNIKGGDYAHFYSFGRLVALDRAAEIYEPPALQQEIERSVSSSRTPLYLSVYGPQVALALAPLGAVPYLISLSIWWALASVTYFAGCWVFWSACRTSWPDKFPSFMLAAAYPGFWQLFIYGQTTWIALACFTVLWFSLRANRWLPTGIAVGLLVFKPQLGLAIAVLLVGQRRWKAIATAAVVVLLQVAICWLLLGVGVLREYLSVLVTLPQVTPLLEPNLSQSASVRGFFLLLGLPASTATVLYLLSAVVVCGGLLHIWRTASYSVAFSSLLIATILLAPHATVYDLVLLAPAFILVVGEGLASGRPIAAPLIGAAYLAPISGPLAQITNVQLVTPVLVLMFVAATIQRRGLLSFFGPLERTRRGAIRLVTE